MNNNIELKDRQNNTLTRDLFIDDTGTPSKYNTYNTETIDEKLNELKAVELYSNQSGSAEDITLSDDVSNYKFVEIVYGEYFNGNFNYLKCQKNPVINGKISSLSLDIVTSNAATTGMILFSKVVSITGNKLSVERSNKLSIVQNSNSFDNSNNNIRIVKVIGIK